MKTRLLRYVEFVFWVAAVAGAIVGVILVPAFLIGEGLLTVKYALFFIGFLMFGVGSFAIQPTPHGKGPVSKAFSLSLDGETEYGFEERLQRLPPLKGEWLPVTDRVSRNTKLFVTSLVLLGISIFLEFGLNVTAR